MANPANNILIGIDGGGTGCRVAIALADKIIGTAKGGPANPTYRPQKALDNILAAIEAARLDAGLEPDTLTNARAFVGLAGVRDDETARFIATGLPIKQASVVEDRITTVTGALAGGDGGVAAIGTGSFIARRSGGDTQYIGGWGFRLGDQASGAWLGHKLLRQVILCAEGVQKHTDLTRKTLADYGNDAHNIYDFSNGAAPDEFGALAPAIVAATGDQVAITLMQAGADYIVKALATLGYQVGDPLCLTGGLGPHYAPFLPPPYAENVVEPKSTALDGALLLAAQMAPAG